MKRLKYIFGPSIIIALVAISSFLFINLFAVSRAESAELKVNLINPRNGLLLSDSIYTSAETTSTVTKVEFVFFDEGGRFNFTYEGTNRGGNLWDYTWQTHESIDGVYRVHAVAVDSHNLTYVSNINRIYVDNTGGAMPDFDQNYNSNPVGNYNINENQNTNTPGTENFNINSNQNTDSENTNSNAPSNSNYNINSHTDTPPQSNNNLNGSTGIPVNDAPDDDNDGLSNEEEAELGTDVNNPDSDNDGLIDGFEEKHGFNPLVDDNNTPNRTPDPKIIQAITDARFGGPTLAKDTDRDGLPDSVEIMFGTDPYRPDTSNDGLTDGFKANNGYPLLTDNSGQITKKKIDLPNPDIESGMSSSAVPTIAIFGTLVLIVLVVLIVFRPRKTRL